MRMHADEIVTDEVLVRRLLAAQFPEWKDLPIEALPVAGTDNAIYRLGDGLSVRLPRRLGCADGSLDKEFEWLPKLAPLLPFEVPTPVARGEPGEGYPKEWAVFDWLEGKDATSTPVDLQRAAADLAELLATLRRIDPAGGPPPESRGAPLWSRDKPTRAGIAALGDMIDADAVTTAWEASLRKIGRASASRTPMPECSRVTPDGCPESSGVSELLEIDDAMWIRSRLAGDDRAALLPEHLPHNRQRSVALAHRSQCRRGQVVTKPSLPGSPGWLRGTNFVL